MANPAGTPSGPRKPQPMNTDNDFPTLAAEAFLQWAKERVEGRMSVIYLSDGPPFFVESDGRGGLSVDPESLGGELGRAIFASLQAQAPDRVTLEAGGAA